MKILLNLTDQAVPQLIFLFIECPFLHFGTAYFVKIRTRHIHQYTLWVIVTQPVILNEFKIRLISGVQ